MAESKTEQGWSDRAKQYLKAELKRRNVTHEELAGLLAKQGLKETRASVASKMSRGTFPAGFFLASLAAIGCENVRIEDV
ncbi:DUF6471 domain-containing protein [Methyloligella solikamskensis]|uniref:DUF6471 domain-containing protein n=1 Tax=Methyloligella solikamskensis TaxID=1177756 RepID=A0ABW3J7B7_9HYPH